VFFIRKSRRKVSMFYVYLGILAIVLALTIWELFDTKKLSMQITAAMVIVPLLLRLLMIK